MKHAAPVLNLDIHNDIIDTLESIKVCCKLCTKSWKHNLSVRLYIFVRLHCSCFFVLSLFLFSVSFGKALSSQCASIHEEIKLQIGMSLLQPSCNRSLLFLNDTAKERHSQARPESLRKETHSKQLSSGDTLYLLTDLVTS